MQLSTDPGACARCSLLEKGAVQKQRKHKRRGPKLTSDMTCAYRSRRQFSTPISPQYLHTSIRICIVYRYTWRALPPPCCKLLFFTKEMELEALILYSSKLLRLSCFSRGRAEKTDSERNEICSGIWFTRMVNLADHWIHTPTHVSCGTFLFYSFMTSDFFRFYLQPAKEHNKRQIQYEAAGGEGREEKRRGVGQQWATFNMRLRINAAAGRALNAATPRLSAQLEMHIWVAAELCCCCWPS